MVPVFQKSFLNNQKSFSKRTGLDISKIYQEDLTAKRAAVLEVCKEREVVNLSSFREKTACSYVKNKSISFSAATRSKERVKYYTDLSCRDISKKVETKKAEKNSISENNPLSIPSVKVAPCPKPTFYEIYRSQIQEIKKEEFKKAACLPIKQEAQTTPIIIRKPAVPVLLTPVVARKPTTFFIRKQKQFYPAAVKRSSVLPANQGMKAPIATKRPLTIPVKQSVRRFTTINLRKPATPFLKQQKRIYSTIPKRLPVVPINRETRIISNTSFSFSSSFRGRQKEVSLLEVLNKHQKAFLPVRKDSLGSEQKIVSPDSGLIKQKKDFLPKNQGEKKKDLLPTKKEPFLLFSKKSYAQISSEISKAGGFELGQKLAKRKIKSKIFFKKVFDFSRVKSFLTFDFWDDFFFDLKDAFSSAFTRGFKKSLAYSLALALFFITIPAVLVFMKGFREKGVIEKFGIAGYGSLKQAQASIEDANIEGAGKDFEAAFEKFKETKEKLDEVGGNTTKVLKFLPGLSLVESGRKLASVGENISLAGKEITQAMSFLAEGKEGMENSFLKVDGDSSENKTSLLDLVSGLTGNLKEALARIDKAQEDLGSVNPNDFPEAEKKEIIALSTILPQIKEGLEGFFRYNDLFLEILGANGSRRYLLIFQNNHEIRATGGFIGTYGIVKILNGKVEKLDVDGIYDPDGQLKEKIIPPEPIQKMSVAWSMHDANWWPNFPTSAQKISWFYEKTGGPTVDGVIALNPKVIQDILRLTGPIVVSGYGEEGELSIDADNFMEKIQYQVEVAYDKTENEPKKILTDMTPELIRRVITTPKENWPKMLAILGQSLKARDLMFYSFDSRIQNLISDMGWSGEILKSSKDYLSVVNTNISGLKTDGIVDQAIKHSAEIMQDGSIVDTVTIKRTHLGGKEKYDWHNAVNSDWMRVYVPEGSELIAASGFTKEFVDPPLDYERLGFKEDFEVKQMESSYKIDEESATRVYNEQGKTVFGNWVYVSPGEVATVTYKYLLPFRLEIDGSKKLADSYSLLIQKQSGDERSEIELELFGLDDYNYVYKYPQDILVDGGGWKVKEKLDFDKFFALVVKRAQK